MAHFTVPEDFMSSLIAKATDAGIEYNEEQYQRSLPLMTAIIKGLIARDLYENASYFRHIAPLNKDYLEALRVIHDPSRYNRILLTGEDTSPVQESATPAATE